MEEVPDSQVVHVILHPLMVDLILEKVVHTLDIKTLKTVRHVCRRWSYLASPSFVSKTRLDLVQIQQLGELENLLEHVDSGLSQPFENISLTLATQNKADCLLLGAVVTKCIDPLKRSILSLNIHPCQDAIRDPSSGPPILVRILRLPWRLQSLSISILPRLVIDNLMVFLKHRTHHLPLKYVKEFKINQRCVYPEGFLQLLLAEMPNVKTLVFKDSLLQTTESILKLILKFQLHSLTELRFDGMSFLRTKGIECLTNAKLSINSLSIDFSWFCDVTHAQDYLDKCNLFLASLSKTLKTLRVKHKGRDGYPGSKIVMPHLPELISLHLEDWSDFGPLGDFMEQLPSLKALKLESKIKSYEWVTPRIALTKFVAPDMRIHPQLEELNLFPFTIPDECFKRILNVFPNLKRLSIKGTESLLGVLFATAAPIIDLTFMVESQISDYGITGVHVQDLDLGLKNPSIKKVTGLRRLKIDGLYSFITDTSVNYGIKYLTNLTSLSLRNCILTPVSLKELVGLPLMHLDLTNSLTKYDEEQILPHVEYLKRCKPMLHIIIDQDPDC